MRKQFLKSMLLALLCVVGGVTSAWGYTPTLTENFSVVGYKLKAYYNIANENVGSMCPTEGDLRYRGSGYGFYNYGSGDRNADVALNVAEGDLLLAEFYDSQKRDVTINSISNCTKNNAVSSGAVLAYNVNADASSLKFDIGRAGCIVAFLVMEMDPVTATYDFENEVNPFKNNIRITSAIAQNETLNSKVLGFTTAGNAGNGFAFSYFDLTSLFVKSTKAIFELDFYTDGGRTRLTIGDRSVRGDDGGSAQATYNSEGTIFYIGAKNDTYFQINGTNLTPADYIKKWLHVKVTVDTDNKKISYVVSEKATGAVLKEESNKNFYNENAKNCTQIDLYDHANNNNFAIDNLSIKYIPGSVDYTVNGVDADGNMLYEVAKGTGVQLTKLKVPYHNYLNNNGTLLVAGDTGNEFNYSFTLDSDPTTKNIVYNNAGVEGTIVYLSEAEDIEGATRVTKNNADIRCSMSAGARFDADTKITTLPAGKYKIFGQIWGSKGSNDTDYTFTIKAGENEVWSLTTTGSRVNATSEEFELSKQTDIIIPTKGDNNRIIDLIYIVKTGEASDDALLAAAKDDLQSLITEAEALEGTEGKTAFDTAVAAAQNTYDESTDTDKVKAAIAALTLAIKKFKAANVTDVADGTYYIKNVSTGKWLGPGNSWGTQASMLNHADYWKLKLNDGKYTLESVVSNGGQNYYLSGTYCDGGATNFTLTKVEGAHLTYTIANGENNLLTANGNIVDMSGTDATAAVSQWQFFSEDDMALMLADATIQAPADATYLIKDHDLGRNNRDYAAWSNTNASAPKTSDNPEGNSSRYSVEAYHATFDVNQTLTNIPNGVYAVQVNGFYRQDGSEADLPLPLPYVYANDSKVTLPARTGSENSMQAAAVSFEAGNYLSEPAYVQVTNGRLKLGVATTGTSCWVIFKNFHLTYYGDVDPRDVLPAITLAEGKMNAEVAAAQTAAKAAYDETFSMDNYNALKNAAAAAQASVTLYANTPAIISKAEALKDAHNFATEEAIGTFNAAIVAASTAYEENTLTQAMIDNLGMTVTGWHAADNSAAAVYLKNGFSLPDADWDNLHVNTWSTEGANDGSGFEVPFYEYWTANENSLGANTFTGTLTGLPNGLYNVKATVRVNVKNGVEDLTTATGITMQVNDGETVDVTKGTQVGNTRFLLKEYTAEGLVKDGNLSLTFNIAEGNNISWLSFQHVYYDKERDLTPEEEFKAATASDYAALTSAITTAEEKTLGFDAAEYAPYNNIDALNALATAKAIDQTVQNEQAAVQAATTALTNAQWNENDKELNAVFDGTFATATNDGAMTGWTTDHNAGLGGTYHARAFVLNNGDNNYDNLATFGQDEGTRSCAYMRFDGTNSAKNTIYTYGATMGYTMPLNADLYLLTAQLGGWGQVDKDVTLRIVDGNNEVVGTQTVHTVPTGINAGGKAVSLSLYFKPEVAGSYRLQVLNSSNADNAIVISNILLMTAPYNPTALNKSISEATALSSKMDEGEAKTALNNAIATAQAAIEAAQNQNDIDSADNALQQAISTAKAAYDLAEAKKLLNDKIQAVKTYTLPAIATTLYKSELTTVSNGLVAATTTEEVDNLNNTFDNLNKTAEGIETKYRQYKDDVTNINTMLASEAIEYNDEAKTTLQNKLSNWDSVIENGEGYQDITTLEYYAAIANKFWSLPMEDGIREFVANVKVKKNEELDITLLLTNPDVSSFWTGAWNVRPEGWYNEQNGGNFQVMANNDMGPDGEVFMEYWSEKAATSGFVLAQKVDLPEGTYKMTGRVGVQQFDGNGTTTNVTFSANDIDGTQIPYGSLVDGEIEFVQPQMGKVTIGLKAHEGNNARWMGINKIKLYKTNNTKTITLSETATYDATQTGVADVTLNRNIKANTWNTLVLPFSLSASELKAAFGNDVKMAEFSEIPNDEVEGQSTINFQTMQEPKLMANTPVLLKTSVAGDSYTFEGRTLVATNEAVKAGAKYFDFVGSYQAETTIGEGNYFISSDKLYQAVSNTKPLKGTRAFIKAREEAQNARVVAFSIDGIETTAIDGLTMQGDDSQEKIFNLNGQQVEKARRGIYVKNGKKVVIR